eukprot:TRINITY_DN17572_c0_g1_i1.p1 TRINITY_DN17572_c0_g1~~TRINITY_DN17572_c0_g1_i1.p1  ORF type:complete len:1532 (+),score=176.89 TRINITY_DN17572_c0_g1_i1:100-4695(+)
MSKGTRLVAIGSLGVMAAGSPTSSPSFTLVHMGDGYCTSSFHETANAASPVDCYALALAASQCYHPSAIGYGKPGGSRAGRCLCDTIAGCASGTNGLGSNGFDRYVPNTPPPTESPTRHPTTSPSSSSPTASPTASPTTGGPTGSPTLAPSAAPTASPSAGPTVAPTIAPTKPPTSSPSFPPSAAPTLAPTSAPTATPTSGPTTVPSSSPPTAAPTQAPVAAPTAAPSISPTAAPSESPTTAPSRAPTRGPTTAPTRLPSGAPTTAPTQAPVGTPTAAPSISPTIPPTRAPTSGPTTAPSRLPSTVPTSAPTQAPAGSPTAAPTRGPTSPPSRAPSAAPSWAPSSSPVGTPTAAPTEAPTVGPSRPPSNHPTVGPTVGPTSSPTRPPVGPTPAPSSAPTPAPTVAPSAAPAAGPTIPPTTAPARLPTQAPTAEPTRVPSVSPAGPPSPSPTRAPTTAPSSAPVTGPSSSPSSAPTVSPVRPTPSPTSQPTVVPSRPPAADPTLPPTQSPSLPPALPPSAAPHAPPTGPPTSVPTPPQPNSPSSSPVPLLGPPPSRGPSSSPTKVPSSVPSAQPSFGPSPTRRPIAPPSTSPSPAPNAAPTPAPSSAPRGAPSPAPSLSPSLSPHTPPSTSPSAGPHAPSLAPSRAPSAGPSLPPSRPAPPPSSPPSAVPTQSPLRPPPSPTPAPVASPTGMTTPSSEPSRGPTALPAPLPGLTFSPRAPSAPPGVPSASPAAARPPVPSAAPNGSVAAPPSRAPSAAPAAAAAPAPHPAPSASPVPGLAPAVAVPAAPTTAPSAVPSGPAPVSHPTTDEALVTVVPGVAAAVSTLSGAHVAGAAQAQRLSLFLHIVQCPPDDPSELGFLSNPTGAGRRRAKGGKGQNEDDDIVQSQRDALLANVFLVAGIVAVHMFATGLLGELICIGPKLARHRRWRWASAVARFPSFSAFPVVFMSQTITEGALTMVYYGDTVQKGVCLGVFVVWSAGVIGYLWWRLDPKRFPCKVVYEEPEPGRCKAFLFGKCAWSDPGNIFERQYSLLFKDFKEKYHRFLIADLIVAVLLSAIGALKSKAKSVCVTQTVGALLIEGLYLAVVAYTRPFISPLDMVVATAMATLQVTGLLFALVAIILDHTDDSVFVTTGMGLFVLSAFILLIKSLLDMGAFIKSRWDWRKREKGGTTKALGEPELYDSSGESSGSSQGVRFELEHVGSSAPNYCRVQSVISETTGFASTGGGRTVGQLTGKDNPLDRDALLEDDLEGTTSAPPISCLAMNSGDVLSGTESLLRSGNDLRGLTVTSPAAARRRRGVTRASVISRGDSRQRGLSRVSISPHSPPGIPRVLSMDAQPTSPLRTRRSTYLRNRQVGTPTVAPSGLQGLRVPQRTPGGSALTTPTSASAGEESKQESRSSSQQHQQSLESARSAEGKDLPVFVPLQTSGRGQPRAQDPLDTAVARSGHRRHRPLAGTVRLPATEKRLSGQPPGADPLGASCPLEQGTSSSASLQDALAAAAPTRNWSRLSASPSGRGAPKRTLTRGDTLGRV